MMGVHWLQVLLAEGFVVQEDGCRYQWQRLPVWFADLERKMAMKKTLLKAKSDEADCLS